jgi:hypothetical protein
LDQKVFLTLLQTTLSLLASLNEAHYSLKLHLIYLYIPGLVSIQLIFIQAGDATGIDGTGLHCDERLH